MKACRIRALHPLADQRRIDDVRRRVVAFVGLLNQGFIQPKHITRTDAIRIFYVWIECKQILKATAVLRIGLADTVDSLQNR
ncbi:hypothetical protein KYG_12789 [Acidovorax sp. NO-1]|nr:hypothetical protein KYG_12789 [Acidovorax sp. NO-1]